MKNRFAALLTLALIGSSSSAALAAATPEEATRLKALFETYLTAEPGVVAVSPDGDQYKVHVDFAPLFAKAANSGATVSMSPLDFTLEPTGDAGKWQFESAAPVTFKLAVATAQSMEASAQVKQSGVWDEALGTFATAQAELTDIAFRQTVNDPAQGNFDVNYTIAKWTASQTAEAAGDGSVNMASTSKLETIIETLKSAGPAAGGMPMDFTLTAASANYDTKTTGGKINAIYSLVAFFIAHQSKELITKDQEQLKTILAAALPLFSNTTATGSAETIAVITPMGPVTIASSTFGADVNGVVKDGKLQERFSFSGVKLPAGMVPPWAATLVPSDLTVDFTVSGFDLEAAAKLALAKLDLTKEPPLPPEMEQEIIPAIMPTGAITFTLNPTSITSPATTLALEGAISYGGGPMPVGSGTVSATTFDEVVKAVSAFPPELGMQGAVAGLMMLKGMGKVEDGGKLSWKIETTPEGSVLVNGMDPMKMVQPPQ